MSIKIILMRSSIVSLLNLVRAAIIDLDVLAPQAVTRPNQRSTLPSAGRMTLLMELVDSVSGAVLARALDYQYDRTPVQTYLGNQARNEKAARQILRHWASLLREDLDEARQRRSARMSVAGATRLRPGRGAA
jgi:hypothetical protein